MNDRFKQYTQQLKKVWDEMESSDKQSTDTVFKFEDIKQSPYSRSKSTARSTNAQTEDEYRRLKSRIINIERMIETLLYSKDYHTLQQISKEIESFLKTKSEFRFIVDTFLSIIENILILILQQFVQEIKLIIHNPGVDQNLKEVLNDKPSTSDACKDQILQTTRMFRKLSTKIVQHMGTSFAAQLHTI